MNQNEEMKQPATEEVKAAEETKTSEQETKKEEKKPEEKAPEKEEKKPAEKEEKKTEEAKEKKQEDRKFWKQKEKDDSEAEIKELKLKVTELEGQIAGLKNDYARAYADTENIRKRMNNEFDQKNKYRIQEFALDILPVLDNCERALNQKTEDEPYRKGVQMIYSQLQAALKKEGVTEIDAMNKPFDSNLHQALISEKKEGTEPGMVIEVLQKGYMLKDRLLRAAMVKVSA